MVRAHFRLRQDDCGGSATALSDDAVAGMQGRRRWATQGSMAAVVGAPGHGCGSTAGSRHEKGGGGKNVEWLVGQPLPCLNRPF